MRNKTYNEIISALESFSEEHLDVLRFAEEDLDQMSEVTSKGEEFPMVFATPLSNIYDYQLNNYRIRVYCYDRLMKDRSNVTNIRSKTNQILNDLDVWLRKESTLPFEITESSDVTPFSSELMTDVTGWYIDINIDVESYSVCNIPFENAPIIPDGCDRPYRAYDYLTCETLKDCSTITDMQQDITDLENNQGIDCDELNSCQTILDIQQDIIELQTDPFDCDELNSCQTILDIQQDIIELQTDPFDCEALDSCQTIIDIKEDIVILQNIYSGLVDDMIKIKTEFVMAINFQYSLLYTYVAPEDFYIDSIENPDGLVLDILVESLPYTLGDTINKFDTLTITPDLVGYILVHCKKII